MNFVSVVVTQLCMTLWEPIDCSPLGSSVRGILKARILDWVAIPFSRIFPAQGLNPILLHCRLILYHLSHQGSLCEFSLYANRASNGTQESILLLISSLDDSLKPLIP